MPSLLRLLRAAGRAWGGARTILARVFIRAPVAALLVALGRSDVVPLLRPSAGTYEVVIVTREGVRASVASSDKERPVLTVFERMKASPPARAAAVQFVVDGHTHTEVRF